MSFLGVGGGVLIGGIVDDGGGGGGFGSFEMRRGFCLRVEVEVEVEVEVRGGGCWLEEKARGGEKKEKDN